MDKINDIEFLIKRYPILMSNKEDIYAACMLLIDCFSSGGKLLVCGNGGSASDASHICGELMKSFKKKRKIGVEYKGKLNDYIYENLECALPCLALGKNNALLTAYSNDKCPDLVFAQEVFGYGKKDDVLLAISTSGNSKNVLYACEVARALGIKVIGLTQNSENKLRKYCDCFIGVEEKETYLIQELHLPIYHAICSYLEEWYF